MIILIKKRPKSLFGDEGKHKLIKKPFFISSPLYRISETNLDFFASKKSQKFFIISATILLLSISFSEIQSAHADQFALEFGSFGTGNGEFDDPHDLTVVSTP